MDIIGQLKEVERNKYNLIVLNSVIIINGERVVYRDDEGGSDMIEIHDNKKCIAATHITDLNRLQLTTTSGKDIDLFY